MKIRQPVSASGSVPSDSDELRFVKMLQALGNPVRFEIMEHLVLRRAGATEDIAAALPVAKSGLAGHLRVLKDAGWIEEKTEAGATSWRPSEENLRWFKARVGKICL